MQQLRRLLTAKITHFDRQQTSEQSRLGGQWQFVAEIERIRDDLPDRARGTQRTAQ